MKLVSWAVNIHFESFRIMSRTLESPPFSSFLLFKTCIGQEPASPARFTTATSSESFGALTLRPGCPCHELLQQEELAAGRRCQRLGSAEGPAPLLQGGAQVEAPQALPLQRPERHLIAHGAGHQGLVAAQRRDRRGGLEGPVALAGLQGVDLTATGQQAAAPLGCGHGQARARQLQGLGDATGVPEF